MRFPHSSKFIGVVLVLFAFMLAGAGNKETKKPMETAKKDVKEAVLETTMGSITFEFLPKLAPKTVENFIKLARKEFYDGTTFHRVIPGFMIQGGDPNSKEKDRSKHGTGGPGYTIKAEFSKEKHVRGTVSMARTSDPDSAGSQFFIVVRSAPHLDGQYTVFGRVTDGLNVVDKIVSAKQDRNNNPLERIEIKNVKLR